MKKIVFFLLIFISYFGFSQNSSEVFSNSKEQNQNTTNRFEDKGEPVQTVEDDDNPPNPGDPAPIDDYLSILFLIGLGGIVYVYRKKRTLED